MKPWEAQTSKPHCVTCMCLSMLKVTVQAYDTLFFRKTLLVLMLGGSTLNKVDAVIGLGVSLPCSKRHVKLIVFLLNWALKLNPPPTYFIKNGPSQASFSFIIFAFFKQTFNFFFKNGPIPASFSVYFRLFNTLQFKFNKFKLKKA